MSIDKKSQPWLRQAEESRLPAHLLDGSRAFRDPENKYLPKNSFEQTEDYHRRLSMSRLSDDYRRTLNFLVGQVFSKNVQIKEDGEAKPFAEWAENADGRGGNLSSFCQDAFRAGINSGVAFLVPEFPRVKRAKGDGGVDMYFDEDSGKWEPLTVEAVESKRWSPYLVCVKAEDVIDVWEDLVNGTPRITHLRYFEEATTQANEWERKKVRRIRVLTAGAWSLYEEATTKAKKTAWTKIDEAMTGIPYVLAFAFRPGEHRENMTARPALEGLAEACLELWQSSTRHRGLIEWVRSPLLFGKCLDSDPEKTIVAGPGYILHSIDPSADVKPVDAASDASVKNSAADIEKTRSEIALYGLRMLAPVLTEQTATGVLKDSAEVSCALQAWANQFQDALNTALAVVASWLKLPEPTAVVNRDFSLALSSIESSTLLLSADKGILPRQVVFEELKRRGVVPDSLEWEGVRAMIEEEARSLSAYQAPAGQDFASVLDEQE